MSADQISRQFLEHYYNTFDADRKALAPLYTPQSVLTWEGKAIQGKDNIINHVSSLPFQNVKRRLNTLDYQPTSNGLMIMATGDLSIDGGNPMKFTHIFHLVNNAGAFNLMNEFLRLNLE
ncbi:nuclear transport factor 2 [Heterostelium album PN500]|uniref:Nuclear transport factor 2 n=1 Tax=Heterostelium pallidum (strain ATCC 26659 / Pp 5 / PN500) TaxID=670386 RepID=D3BQ01_HETP5|nr:nuclear transport factor 2 [Heterostelium album PN500]EFA76552.1 nuclear transport factor 2 [Heterostelium album PN500]|eukprot:XP_020428684.1 nuclear transport factor 2 [Heterostelium album PN500]